jgi:bacteriocin resistance YdeI/OmpD-like protein/uncharacterized protein DUF1905
MSKIRFEARPYEIEGRTVVRLPQKASEKLPSRGQVAVRGTINGRLFQTVLEPDGNAGHWMNIDKASARAMATVEIQPIREWPEPSLPADLESALAAAPRKIHDLWEDITPMARWEWVRWINATGNPETRQRRVKVSISKMAGGKRRPCCFNLAACTDPDLSHNGRLRESK